MADPSEKYSNKLLFNEGNKEVLSLVFFLWRTRCTWCILFLLTYPSIHWFRRLPMLIHSLHPPSPSPPPPPTSSNYVHLFFQVDVASHPRPRILFWYELKKKGVRYSSHHADSLHPLRPFSGVRSHLLPGHLEGGLPRRGGAGVQHLHRVLRHGQRRFAPHKAQGWWCLPLTSDIF